VLALSLPDPPAMGPLFFASFTLLYSQLVLPTPSGVGAVDLGFLAGAAGDLGGHHTSILLIWRFYTTFVPVALGIFLGLQRYGRDAVVALIQGRAPAPAAPAPPVDDSE
jgi:uncharacterized membrane protein YbhN (UPF0104 family)